MNNFQFILRKENLFLKLHVGTNTNNLNTFTLFSRWRYRATCTGWLLNVLLVLPPAETSLEIWGQYQITYKQAEYIVSLQCNGFCLLIYAYGLNVTFHETNGVALKLNKDQLCTPSNLNKLCLCYVVCTCGQVLTMLPSTGPYEWWEQSQTEIVFKKSITS